jgi:bifunctional DNA-binding transcriptional regulator/antitoxin component of YhaV-PrlF toxin-antitoxin module
MMPTFETKVASNGTVKLPPELCRRLDIVEGTMVEFFLTFDGQVHFHALTGQLSEFGIQRRNPPISIREMDDAIAEAVSEKHEQILRQGIDPRKRAAAE